MLITEVRITKLTDSKTLALCSITLDSEFVVSGLAIYNGKNGLWVSLPSRKNKDGEYKDICFPITKEARLDIQNAVLTKYNSMNAKPFNDQDSEDIYNSVKKGQEKETFEIDPEMLPF